MVTKDKPTGDKLSSPNVCKRYVMINQLGAANSPEAAILVAKYITKNPIPNKSKPKVNLSGELGSRFILPNQTHKAAKNGAKMMMNRELIDWK